MGVGEAVWAKAVLGSPLTVKAVAPALSALSLARESALFLAATAVLAENEAESGSRRREERGAVPHPRPHYSIIPPHISNLPPCR